MALLPRFSDALKQLPVSTTDTVILAVSGGPDSLAMLHLFTRLPDRLKPRLVVVHVNHGIRGAEADRDAEFVRDTVDAWGLACRVERCDVPALAQSRHWSIETAARRARYTALAQAAHAEHATLIATAHHQDDQAETILMHVLRGSGLAGLRGMRAASPLSARHLIDPDTHSDDLLLIRPMLGISRAEIEAYCVAQQLEARIDQSNADTTMRRNRLRHEVMPLLHEINPQISSALARLGEIVSGDDDYLAGQVSAYWREHVHETSEGITIPRAGWQDVPLALQRALIQRAVLSFAHDDKPVAFDHIDTAGRMLNDAQVGQTAMLPGGIRLTVRYDDILISGEGSTRSVPDWPLLSESTPISILAPGRITLAESGWDFVIERYRGVRKGAEWAAVLADPWQAVLSQRLTFPLLIRTRQPGDRFYPQGAGGSQKISDFQINAKIPTQWRDHLPVLVSDGEIAWLCGWRVDERFTVSEDDDGVWLASFQQEI